MIWLGLVVIFCLFTVFSSLTLDNKKLIRVSAVSSVVILISPLFYEYSNYPETTVVSFEKEGGVIKHPHGMFCWEFSHTYSNVPAGPISIGGGLTVLTENPKVKEIGYSFDGYIVDQDKFYQDESRRRISYSGCHLIGNCTIEFSMNNSYFTNAEDFGIATVIAELVSRQLYDFNKENSKLLSEHLDNPLLPEQSAWMKEFSESWLNPRLAPQGVSVKFVSFSIK